MILKKIIIYILIILLIFPFFLYRVKVGEIISMEGECYFELSTGMFLPPRNQIIHGIFEHINGKIYLKFNHLDSKKKYIDTIYFWLSPSEIKEYFGKTLTEMESFKCRPNATIKAKTLLNGDYTIISIEKVKWMQGLPYSYE